MNSITKFFHELFNPHCEHCSNERIDSSFCQSCENLKMQLSVYQQQNDKLINRLLTPINESSPPAEIRESKPLQTKMVPWNVKRQQLEAESRELARSLKSAATPDKPASAAIKELEKELGVTNGTESTGT